MPLLDVGEGESVLDRAVDVAHRHLALDAVYVAELTQHHQIYRATAGDAAAFGVLVGGRTSRRQTFSSRLAAGEIPSVLSDVRADRRVNELAGALSADVGAYVGVPVYYSDGRLYGTLCGVSRRPNHSLDARDVRFLDLLAELLAGHLDEMRTLEDLRTDIRSVIDDERLDVAAQPIVSLRDGRCLGVEALARFPSGEGAPTDVFAAAESVGLGVELERLAVQRAWPLLGQLGPNQFLTVNLSPSAAVELSRRASRYEDGSLALSQLVVEITEHSAISSYADLRAVLEPLRRAGLRVAVDDVGAGYASLRHVVELRPNFIKIDRDLVHGLADDHARRVAVSAFVLLALDLNAMVVAEGLERPTDLAALCDLGVDAAQGFLLGRPSVRADDLRSWLGSPSLVTDELSVAAAGD
jgi:EAL domain-containing protein (putative c-di-GMP-specific phosphodiesterase class I)